MKNFYQIITLLGVMCLFNLGACVSSKKYQAMVKLQEETEITAEAIDLKNQQLKNENKNLLFENKLLREENHNLKKEIMQISENQDISEKELLLKYQSLLNQYEELVQNSSLEAKIYRDTILNKNRQIQQINQFSNIPNNQTDKLNHPLHLTTPNQVKPSNENPSQLFDNQVFNNQLQTIFRDLSTNEFSYFYKNKVWMLGWSDEWLFDKQYTFRPQSLWTLQQMADLLKNYANLDIYLHTESQNPDNEKFILLKLQNMEQFFQQFNLATQALPKDFVPLAFATSGTESRAPFTYCLIKLRD